MKKHAYLIMAHSQFEILEELIQELDDESNDIYLHIDLKTKNIPQTLGKNLRRAHLFFIERMNVNWGGYSQIECELRLMESAKKNGPYMYYHMLTGMFFPIKSQKYIHDFFESHEGYEFIGFDNSKDYSKRVKYHYLFNEIGKPKNKIIKFLFFLRHKYLKIQKVIIKQDNKIYKKGLVYWSLTEKAIDIILNERENIQKEYKHSFCADEIFVQTIIYNSNLRDKIYNYNNERKSSLCISKPPKSWCHGALSVNDTREESENSFTIDDIEYLLNSPYIYAMKFSGDSGKKAINKIKTMNRDGR